MVIRTSAFFRLPPPARLLGHRGDEKLRDFPDRDETTCNDTSRGARVPSSNSLGISRTRRRRGSSRRQRTEPRPFLRQATRSSGPGAAPRAATRADILSHSRGRLRRYGCTRRFGSSLPAPDGAEPGRGRCRRSIRLEGLPARCRLPRRAIRRSTAWSGFPAARGQGRVRERTTVKPDRVGTIDAPTTGAAAMVVDLSARRNRQRPQIAHEYNRPRRGIRFDRPFPLYLWKKSQLARSARGREDPPSPGCWAAIVMWPIWSAAVAGTSTSPHA
ncbi:MAG: hypothetical protein HW404_1552 [Anaerolineales bacterium]|nr:hypothetical protein [Anaerolineales bacterium]